MLERLIAQHCGPALAGIKPANMASILKSRVPDVHAQLERLEQVLGGDIHIEILCECEARVMVLAYRESVLRRQLQKPEMRRFLTRYGYPEDGTLKEYIGFLRLRLLHENFPHEVGVFLGYPLHDIHGFIHHRDQGCLLCGEWKVYHDEKGARKLFSRYEACRKAIVGRIDKGQTLAQIFCAA